MSADRNVAVAGPRRLRSPGRGRWHGSCFRVEPEDDMLLTWLSSLIPLSSLLTVLNTPDQGKHPSVQWEFLLHAQLAKAH